MPHLLIDTLHATCGPQVLPRAWLDGFDLSIYRPGYPDQQLSGPASLLDADALMLRSVSKVNAAMLATSPRLRAVATCSSGTDHVDVRAMARARVPLFSGRGGNAIAVTEWVAWALHRQWSVDPASDKPWRGRRIIVVGVGAVGACVRALARQLGANVIAVDPPRAARDQNFAGDPNTMSLAEALQSPCDALTLHVPLVDDGPHPTRGLIDVAEIDQLSGATLLNAARGGVIVEQPAAAARRAGRLSGLWCDTFCNEPRPDPAFVTACDGATPHIAGHSIAGKLKVAWLPMQRLRARCGLPATLDLVAAVHLAREAEPSFDVVLDRTSEQLLADAVKLLASTGDADVSSESLDFRPLRTAHRRREGGVLLPSASATALLEVGCPKALADMANSL